MEFILTFGMIFLVFACAYGAISGIKEITTANVSYTIKTSYLINLINVLPKKIRLPKTNSLLNLSTTEKIKTLSKHVVLIKTRFE